MHDTKTAPNGGAMTSSIARARNTLLHGVSAAALACALFSGAQAHEHIVLTAQPLATSLNQIGKSANIQFLYDPGIVRGEVGMPVNGQYTADQAMTKLLDGTGLTHRFVNRDTVVIEREAEAGAGSAAQPKDDTDSSTQGPRSGLEEIVVTAQKRAENLQSVPISVTALTGSTVQSLQVTNLEGLNNKIPNVRLDSVSNAPNSATISIRGIGVIEADPYAGNTVSVVVDGVPQFFSMGALLDLYDLDRVEVLRGPQGTLFGANTTGGVVNIITEQPTGEFGGSAEVTLGNWNRLDARAAINVPIVEDVLAGKVAVSHHGRDGWITNILTGEDMGSRDVTILRGYLKYTPSPDFDATLIGEYDRARNGAPAPSHGASVGDRIFTPAGPDMYYGACTVPNTRCVSPNDFLSASDQPDISDMDTYRGTLTMNLRNTGIGDITAITGYKEFDLLEYTDQDGTPDLLLHTRRATSGWQLSQELRTAADLTDSINVIVGGFYMKTHYDHLQGSKVQFAGPGMIQINSQDQDNWSLSGFAQTYIDVTSRLQIQGGIRFTHEKTSMLASTVTSVHPSGFTDYDGTGNDVVRTIAPPRDSETWNNFGWKLGLSYAVTDDVMTYGHWARGFKSGGFSGRIGLPQDLGPYDPEKVDTFEIGVKGDLIDRRLRANLSAFYTDYRDMQLVSIYNVQVDGVTVSSTRILNAAKAEIKGVELELTALPMTGLTLNGSVAYLDAKFSDFPFISPQSVTPANPTGVLTNLRGNPLQNAPKWSATADAAYEFALGSGYATARAAYSFVDEKYLSAVVNVPKTNIQPMHLVDASVEWTPQDESWSIGLWARNLFDNRYISSVTSSAGLTGFVNYMPPRQYGATVKVNW